MLHQLMTPIGNSIAASSAVAALPIAAVLVLLGVVRRPAWQASAVGLVIALILAVTCWTMPIGLALDCAAAGGVFALWPVMWIVFNALVLYNLSVASGQFEALRCWLVRHLPDDRRVVLVVIGFAFGCLLEGVAGFGAPIAITSALLIGLGFPALDALVFTLMFNTAPVAFGALGAPVTTLAAVTQLPDHVLGAMIGRQLPIIALFLPFYVTAVYGGVRALRGVWPVLLVAGASFGLTQFLCANFLGYALTDVLSSLACLIVTLSFCRVWKPVPDPAYALTIPADLIASARTAEARAGGALAGWLPWLVLSATVTIWIHFKINLMGRTLIQWPGLHNAVFITAYGKPYAAVWDFQPLATGSAILVASIVTAALCRQTPGDFVAAFVRSLRQVRLPALTTTLIVALAYLMNYSGMAYTLGVAVASSGLLFPFLSAFLGWLAVFLSGSDTSGNALFGNLQVVAAHKLNLNPILMAATNSSGGVMGKMISPQNISTGTVVTDLRGHEGKVLARTFKHSIALTCLLGLLVVVQQYVTPWIIPS
ncbi:L-lactate permease [Sphingomonas nostoxanthinifaciens]|uniref:L-lactate permease n=1 Tax=Sphingomonas nostoxanthinifaciens TaxID=2872652 RepID=UPI001CC1DEA1|nr:L-lactate permease [Sphingomonas nostoxanthinifaciens]UAK25907.1 L-lactate permease [Sphingomonas nostoxanthinifaciens]